MKLDHSKLSKQMRYLLDFGIIVIDKPVNLTSHQTADEVKKILSLEKTGHSGTLDPKVTGVLPVALNKATRIMEILLKSNKAYIALMHFHSPVDKDKVELILKEKFLGTITQLPPVRCAVKRQLRDRHIYSIKILEISEDNKDYLIEVYCEAGTYIRKLIHDIGLFLDVGAHMQELRRIKSSHFTEKDLVTLQELEDAVFLANNGDEKELFKIIKDLSSCFEDECLKINLKKEELKRVIHGMSFIINKEYKEEVPLFYDNKLIGIGKSIGRNLFRAHRVYFDVSLAKIYLGFE